MRLQFQFSFDLIDRKLWVILKQSVIKKKILPDNLILFGIYTFNYKTNLTSFTSNVAFTTKFGPEIIIKCKLTPPILNLPKSEISYVPRF